MSTVNMHGNPLPIEGNQVKVGDVAPNFTVCASDLSPKTLADYKDKVVVLVSVPSFDTPVCDMEIRRFNKEATALSSDVQILAISCDLPFAQARFCTTAGVEAVEALSDYKDVDFGKNYGVLISPLRLLTRAVFVVDKAGKLVHTQIVPEVTEEPNYDSVLEAVKKAL